jgi:dihydroorotate dehydrogenase electron transfer subunit
MPPYLEQCEVVEREQIQENLVYLRCKAPGIAQNATPGQFVHVRAGSGNLPILRRPYSLFDVNGDSVDLLVAVVGRGSAIIANTKPGEDLDIIGPLGNGFPVEPPDGSVIMIAGGVGVAPLHFLWRQWEPLGLRGKFLLGADSQASIPLPQKSPLRKAAKIATEDGSFGFHGTVVEQFEELIGSNNQLFEQLGMVYVCGPISMIRTLVPVLSLHRLHGLVSVEQTMGCGVGACHGCAVAKSNSAPPQYLLTCLDGPVFKFEDIDVDYLTEHPKRKVPEIERG